jgi:hypothetical protein
VPRMAMAVRMKDIADRLGVSIFRALARWRAGDCPNLGYSREVGLRPRIGLGVVLT